MGNFASTSGGAFTPSDAFFLVEATRSGSLEVVRLFLKKNPALVYATDASDASTPWHVAASAGHDVVLRVLIDTTRAHAMSNNFDPLSKAINKQNAKGQTPLMLACAGGHSVCVRLLLESGAHLLVADTTGRSALHYAALHSGDDGKGNDCVELLLAHMQQQLIAQGPIVAPPVVHANVIRKFADSGDMYNRTALHCAAWSGNARAVHALWAVGADICVRTAPDCYDSDLPCNSGTTPLHFAAMRGHQPVVVLLLAAWHRMVTRPSAPLPRGPFSRLPPSQPQLQQGEVQKEHQQGQERREGDADPGGDHGAGGRVEGEPQATVGGEPQRGRQHGESPPPPQQQPVEDGKPFGTSGLERSVEADQAGRSGKGANDRAAEGGAGAEGGARTEEEGQQPRAEAKPEEERRGGAEAGVAGSVVATAGLAASEAAATSAPATTQSSDGGASGGSSGSGSGSSAGGSSEDAAPVVQLPMLPPRPPSPRPPPEDPRLMVDAYGMTPYSIACKKQDRTAGMLIELLDPSTDFCAGEESAGDSDDDGDGRQDRRAVDGGGNGGDTAAEAAEVLRRLRGRGGGGIGRRRRGGGEDSDDDDDSDAGAAGPLLLYEGVELIQSIATDPERFYALQQTEALLQPLQPEDARLGGGAGQRASVASVATRQGSQSGGGSRRATRSTTEVVPDCFLCPLTCQVFRDPVVAADGVTYEREAIERHLRHVPTSPVTKQRLISKHIYANTALKAAIEHWRAAGFAARPGGNDM